MRNNNGTVCMMGKYHNILYVAVSTLLEGIYACEKTFERILIGAIFGNKAPHYIAGWKCDFDTQEENLRALIYFIDKANDAGLELPFCNDDKLLIFLRFGAKVYNASEDSNVFEHLLNRLLEFNHVYPYNLVSCLQLLLRVVPTIKLGIQDDITEEEYKIHRERFLEKYSNLVEDGLVPLSRYGFNSPELKHLCRCTIRERLWENYQLPNGIKSLAVPESLWRYLDILED
ncbi:hypothetical protein NQ314_009567 [Rhamnusium bicolor]|uniref:SOCS box domain-containing protein n=1 Tax=Rhamnusium bicolor TaxID=1586634 RepID=A0AAV8XY85_9CUCU|nr:hypothetical protein NQ314_009567 [Rhamnusium bicolor]